MIKKKKKKNLSPKKTVKRSAKNKDSVGKRSVSSSSQKSKSKSKSKPKSKSIATKELSKAERHARQIAHLKPWKPGQSGNPGGRPKGSSITALRRLDLKRLAKTAPYAKKLAIALGLKPGKATIGDVLAARANQKAMEEASYYRENLNRDEGKIPDKLIGAVETGPLSQLDEETLERIIGTGKPEDE